MSTHAEAFVELYNAETGYNLRHHEAPEMKGQSHITGEQCPCSPEHVPHNLGVEVNDGTGTAFPPNGADDAPDESKDGQPSADPAPAPHLEAEKK